MEDFRWIFEQCARQDLRSYLVPVFHTSRFFNLDLAPFALSHFYAKTNTITVYLASSSEDTSVRFSFLPFHFDFFTETDKEIAISIQKVPKLF